MPLLPVALVLAAGVGARLGRADALPKALLRFGGKTLLRRHLEALAACGVREAVIAVGHRAEAVEHELAEIDSPLAVRTIANHRYTAGSAVTLSVLLEDPATVQRDVLVMDADVLYHPDILVRLVRSRHASCCLLDRELEPSEEPVKLRVRDGRPVELRKVPDPGIAFDLQGESVGFFRFDPPAVHALRRAARTYAEAAPHTPHEDAIRDLVLADHGGRIGYEEVTGLPWIEIDFPEDVERAEREVLPLI